MTYYDKAGEVFHGAIYSLDGSLYRPVEPGYYSDGRKQMKVYLAGPMRGIPEFNFRAFLEAGRKLEEAGFEVFNPAQHEIEQGFSWSYTTGNEEDVPRLRAALAADLAFITEEAAGIVVLPGWQNSAGARAEVATARALNLPVLTVEQALEYAINPVGPDGEGTAPPLETYTIGPLHIPTAEEVRVTSETGGQKGMKLARLSDLDPQVLLKLGEVAGYGAQKYDRLNYMKGYDWNLNMDALERHVLAFWSGEDIDPESGLPHLAHAMWHCHTLLSFWMHGLGTDTRYKEAS